MSYLDRSRMLEYQRCPRAYWYGYGFPPHGVELARAASPLATGGAVHRGIEHLLRWPEMPLKDAVEDALAEYADRTVAGLQLAEGEVAEYVLAEQRALIEALVRGWAIAVLPQFTAQYEVLELERECQTYLGNTLLMARADAVVQERDLEDIFVVSFKTASGLDRRRIAEAQHDDQGISELVALREQYPNVEGVLMYYLLKGERREQPRGSGKWIQNSPLIRGYHQVGVVGEKWSGEYKYGKGWERVDLFDKVKWWVERVSKEEPDLLVEQFPSLPPLYRHRAEVDHWIVQAANTAQEMHTKTYMARASLITDRRQYEEVLDSQFPQHRRSCDWPSRCQYQDICFGPIDPMNPTEDGTYRGRVPNHLVEIESVPGSTPGVAATKPLMGGTKAPHIG